MSELDHRQQTILDNWKNGLHVPGFNGSEFGIEHAMMSAVTGEKSKAIAHCINDGTRCGAGLHLDLGITLVARELAAAHMGYPYLEDAEKAMQIEDFSITIKSTSLAEIFYTVGDGDVVKSIDIDVSFDDGEEEVFDCPATPASAEIVGAFGLNIAESHEWTKYLCESGLQIERELFEMRKQESNPYV